jgi:hypothetical protein
MSQAALALCRKALEHKGGLLRRNRSSQVALDRIRQLENKHNYIIRCKTDLPSYRIVYLGRHVAIRSDAEIPVT